jgi:hypothetical protein
MSTTVNNTAAIRAALEAAKEAGTPVTVTYVSGRRGQWMCRLPNRRVVAVEERPYRRYAGASVCVALSGGEVIRLGRVIGVANASGEGAGR